jgi:hypothetical protein
MNSNPTDCCKAPIAVSKCGCGPATSPESKVVALPPIDKRGDTLCRLSNRFRMRYSIPPGIYTIGNPSDVSPVLVTANYRLTCDHLRKELEGKSMSGFWCSIQRDQCLVRGRQRHLWDTGAYQ